MTKIQELNQGRDRIKSLIRTNKIAKAFESLHDFIAASGNDDLESDLILLESRFNQNKKLFLNIGEANEEKRNKIVLGLIEILNMASKTADAQKANLQSEIEAQEKQVQQLVDSQLGDMIVPNNYEVEVSNEFKFSFCYPQNWSFNKYPQRTVQYGHIIENEAATDFDTNMNVVIDDISHYDIPLKELYIYGVNSIQEAMPDAVLIFSEIFLFKGLKAIRSRINYMVEGTALTLFQVSVADASQERLFHISFTCLAEKYEDNKLLFENIISTLRF